jgi:hypothetical protein
MPISLKQLGEGIVVPDRKKASVRVRVKAFLFGEVDPLTDIDWPAELNMTQEEIINSGWTQQEIAEKLEVTEQQVNQSLVSGKDSLHKTGEIHRRTIQVGNRTRIYNTASTQVI